MTSYVFKYLWNEEKIFKKENAILEGPFKYESNGFHLVYHLSLKAVDSVPQTLFFVP